MNKRYLGLVILGIIALYPSSAMVMIWIDIWTRGARLLYEPNLTIRVFETILTLLGFAFQIFVLFYFYLKHLQMSRNVE